jgi:NADH:ubiquinone oxidoreductase subunit K
MTPLVTMLFAMNIMLAAILLSLIRIARVLEALSKPGDAA